MNKIRVNTRASYDVVIGKGLLENCAKLISGVISSRKTVIVTDDNVDALYGDKLRRHLSENGYETNTFVFKNGEPSKCHSTLVKIYDFLCKCQITRNDFIIALGGGVVGDLAGFAAATYLRGIDYIQVPTTLLAQIDSSVGGKTAVDIKYGKNLVGAFWQPKLVVCDISVLETLSPEVFSDGIAEAIKYGVIKSRRLFDEIANLNPGDDLTEIITQCIQIKTDIVSNDEFESGERMLLNFGHTLGHGIERYYNYEKYTHGSAVAIGMQMMTDVCEKYGIAQSGSAKLLNECLKKYSLPYEIQADINEIIECCLYDKKRQNDSIKIVVPNSIGTSNIMTLSIDDFRDFARGDYKR